MQRVLKCFAGLCLLALLVPPYYAKAQNIGPPAGAILDLSGNPLPSVWTQYSVNFTASGSTTDITFLFRNDPGWTGMDDVSVTTGGGPNLITNGGFESGLSSWTYLNVYGASFGGSVRGACFGVSPRTGTSEWCDGATQAYDAIDQVINTTIGDTYTISFYLNQIDATGVNATTFQDLSTNGNVTDTGGNGVDTLVYAGNAPPPPTTPEPASLTLLATGLASFGIRRLRRKA